MISTTKKQGTKLATTIASILLGSAVAFTASASSHREAPNITEKPKVDNTDFYMFNSYFSEEAASRYPGVIRQIITHHIYTMLYLVGKPKEIMAMKSSLHYEELTKEDLAMVLLKLENDALVHFDLSFAADDLSSDPWTFLLKVLGTEGSAKYTWQDKVLAKKGISHTREYVAYPDSFISEVDYFVDICINGGIPKSTLDDAIDAQSILEAIEMSIEKKQGVSWPKSISKDQILS